MPLLRPLSLSLTLGLGTALLATTHTLHSRHRPLLCEGAFSTPPSHTLSESVRAYSRDAQVPVFKDGGVNRAAFGQLSSGSVCGLLGGLAVSTFSKTLALLLGSIIFGFQYLASKGYNVIPTARIQRYVKGIDLRSAIEDNVAFKLSFGLTFALASFAEL